jgi:uncharacterized iron-regulated protein
MNRCFTHLEGFLLLAAFTCVLAHTPLAAASIPLHQIAISFEMASSTVNGTSRITLPPEMPLRLNCGPLQVTGLVVERQGITPHVPRLNESNSLILPAANDSQTLTLSWQLVVSSKGGQDNRIGNDGITLAGFWHPVADRDMLFSLDAQIPRDFEAISEADSMKTLRAANDKQVSFSLAQPLRSLHFVAGPYTVRSKQVAGITLSTYFFHEDTALADVYLKKTAALIDRYQRLIGPFPYKRFAIVANRLPTGYGLPTFTLLGQTVLRLPFIVDTSLGHEVVHSWFGNAVLVGNSGGNWCEGLTTYLADQRFAAEKDRGSAFRKAALIRYQAFVHSGNAIPLTAFQGAGDNQPIGRVFRAVGYDKSAMFFHMLQLRIGKEAFTAGLQRFYQQMRGRRATWKDLESAFRHSSGKELHPFFQQWLERTDIPIIAVENTKIDQRKGRTILNFDLVQDTVQPYLLDVPIRIRTLTGETITTPHTDSTRKPVSLELDSLPTSLVVDGEYHLMRRIDVAEQPPTWSQFLGAEQKTVIVPPGEVASAYQPLIETLRQLGCRMMPHTAVKNSMLNEGSWLFLHDSATRRSLFAEPTVLTGGFRLDVRRSPLNQEQVMVLVDSSSTMESRKAVSKIAHYGAYSLLQFNNGKNSKKATSTSTNGMVLPLLEKPKGVPTQAILDFARIIDDLAPSRVIYAGETHTEYGSHLVQLQILQALHNRKIPLIIGLEMFPRSRQQALDDYIQGKIDEAAFISASGYFEVWGYDYRLYRDIIQYAREQHIPLLGLNLDKAITRRVYADGSTDGLTPEQQSQVAQERDLDLPGYRQRLETVHSQHDSPHGASFTGFFQSQALWDETMAESIVLALQRYPDHRMLVLAGNGHVVKDSGIPPRVKRRKPNIVQRVVSTINQEQYSDDQFDYLMFAQSIELSPAGKLGVMLKEEGEQDEPGRVRITGISPHGLAGKAGLKEQDRILTLEGRPVTRIADIKIELMDAKAGDTVQMSVLRHQKKLHVIVELSVMAAGGSLPMGHPK